MHECMCYAISANHMCEHKLYLGLPNVSRRCSGSSTVVVHRRTGAPPEFECAPPSTMMLVRMCETEKHRAHHTRRIQHARLRTPFNLFPLVPANMHVNAVLLQHDMLELEHGDAHNRTTNNKPRRHELRGGVAIIVLKWTHTNASAPRESESNYTESICTIVLFVLQMQSIIVQAFLLCCAAIMIYLRSTQPEGGHERRARHHYWNYEILLGVFMRT